MLGNPPKRGSAIIAADTLACHISFFLRNLSRWSSATNAFQKRPHEQALGTQRSFLFEIFRLPCDPALVTIRYYWLPLPVLDSARYRCAFTIHNLHMDHARRSHAKKPLPCQAFSMLSPSLTLTGKSNTKNQAPHHLILMEITLLPTFIRANGSTVVTVLPEKNDAVLVRLAFKPKTALWEVFGSTTYSHSSRCIMH